MVICMRVVRLKMARPTRPNSGSICLRLLAARALMALAIPPTFSTGPDGPFDGRVI